jgi:hypothetical protein
MYAKRIGALVGALTLAGSGTYVFVYLNRWEWNRAIVSGVIFIAAELALVGWLLADRLRVVNQRLDGLAAAGTDRTGRLDASARALRALRETGPAPRAGFSWLVKNEGTNVFVPVLMGAGVVLSALAWVVERLARATARPVAEKGLAQRMGTLALPSQGFLDAGPDQLDLLRGPIGQVRP